MMFIKWRIARLKRKEAIIVHKGNSFAELDSKCQTFYYADKWAAESLILVAIRYDIKVLESKL